MFYDYPMFFEKNRVFRVYKGGALFSSFFGDDSVDDNYPEEWVASCVHAINEGHNDIHEGVSKIKDADMYLDEAIDTFKEKIIGQRDDMGILTKILDSAIRLPVQAHPDKKFAEKYFASLHGKEESWVILDVRPGAKVYYGFREGVTGAMLKEAVKNSDTDKQAMESLLVPHEVKPGDVVYIPGKMVHAIGAGCLLLEVQEPTDYTIQPERWCGDYRLSDNEMFLGLDKDTALECLDIDNVKEDLHGGSEKERDFPEPRTLTKSDDGTIYESLIDERSTQSFCVRRINLTGGRFVLDKGAAVYVVTQGEGSVCDAGYGSISTALNGDDIKCAYVKKLCKGDYFLMPEKAKEKFVINGTMTVVEAFAGCL